MAAGEIPTFKALGGEFARSEDAARKWIDHPEWPQGIRKAPPWPRRDMRLIRKFVAGLKPSRNPSGKSGGRRDLDDEARLMKARADSQELKNALARKELVRRSVVQRRMVGAITAVGHELDSLAGSLPAELRTVDPSMWGAVLKKRFDEMRERFAAGVGGGDGGGE